MSVSIYYVILANESWAIKLIFFLQNTVGDNARRELNVGNGYK